ncbi:MAG: hypothetical protein LBT59_11390 [Clostridiales bacterium]|nr:hypothetical protein [Clostridiales bacterium]
MRIVEPKSALYEIYEKAYPDLECWAELREYRQGKIGSMFASIKQAVAQEYLTAANPAFKAKVDDLVKKAKIVLGIPLERVIKVEDVSDELPRIFATGLENKKQHWFSTKYSAGMSLLLLLKTESNLALRGELLDLAISGAGIEMTQAEKEVFIQKIVDVWDDALKILYAGLYAHDKYVKSIEEWVESLIDESLKTGYAAEYRNALWNQHKYWETRDNDFKSLKSKEEHVLFGDMYVLPGFKTQDGEEMELDRIAASSARMITAQTSLGKSSYLKAIALASIHLETMSKPPEGERSACSNISEFAHKLGVWRKSYLPVYFACRRFESPDDDIIKTAIEDTFALSTGVKSEARSEDYMPMLKKAALGNRLILLVDGYDEVPENLRLDFRKALDAVLIKLPKAKVIMTCRPLPGGADGNLVIGNVTFAPVALQPFDKKRQDNLLDRLRENTYTDKRKIEAVRILIDTNRYVKELAANPYALISIAHHYAGSVSLILDGILGQLIMRHMDMYSTSLTAADLSVDAQMAKQMFMSLAIDAISAEGGSMRESLLESSFKAYWRKVDLDADDAKLDAIWKLTRMMFGCRAGIIVAANNGYRFLADVIHWHLAADYIEDTQNLTKLEEVKSDPVFAVLSMMVLVKMSDNNNYFGFELSVVQNFVKRLDASSGVDKIKMVEILSDLIFDVYGNSHVTSQLLEAGSNKDLHKLIQRAALEAYLLNVADIPKTLAETRIYKSHKEWAEELLRSAMGEKGRAFLEAQEH